jgi:FKBP-type peptidyl-prolyl cis-trans isomerase SlyD
MAKHVIAFNYTLTNNDGQTLDASQEGHPLIFMTESGQIIPGLEHVLIGMAKTDKKTITVPAKEAYGEYDSRLIYKVDRAKLPTQDLKIGDMFEAGEDDQFFPVMVKSIEGNDVTLDGNHPLAGQDLTFAVEITDKRLATPEEVAHGHAHGTGGCNH